MLGGGVDGEGGWAARRAEDRETFRLGLLFRCGENGFWFFFSLKWESQWSSADVSLEAGFSFLPMLYPGCPGMFLKINTTKG